MAIQPGKEIGEEAHDDRDQLFRIEEGRGEIWIEDVGHTVEDDDGIVVPQGAKYNVKATGDEPLRPFTIHEPPEQVDTRCTGPARKHGLRTTIQTGSRRSDASRGNLTRKG
jgi:mannose-6-phosphate isomerase-like protein (cupin superfamily)